MYLMKHKRSFSRSIFKKRAPIHQIFKGILDNLMKPHLQGGYINKFKLLDENWISKSARCLELPRGYMYLEPA
jgi:hypothetical protein